ncbi:MAG: hypothetical protein IT529_00250 [Burkholderiales bacterium]|nr:hypothetical protein [Burkholderiales bacterium]
MIRSRQILTVVSCIALLIVQSGCAVTPPRLTDHEKANLGTIAVAAGRSTPAVRIQGPGTSGGLAGVAIGGGLGVAVAAGCTPQPLMVISCGTVLLLSTALGAAAGGLIGSQVESHVKGKQVTEASRLPLDGIEIQIALRERVIQRARETTPFSFVAVELPGSAPAAGESGYGTFPDRGIDTLLEIDVLDVGTRRGHGELLALTMSCRARVIRVADRAVLAEGVYRYRSDERTYEAWTDGDAEVLRTSLESAYAGLAEQIVMGLFAAPGSAPREPVATAPATRVAPEPAQPHAAAAAAREAPQYALRPRYPELRRCVICASGNGIGGIEFVALDTLTPALAWEPLAHAGASPGTRQRDAGTPRNVRYDVALHTARFDERAGVWIPGAAIYVRERLTQPGHRVEPPLEPCTRYFWTFRVRFDLYGVEHATAWMSEYHRPPASGLFATLDGLIALLPASPELAALRAQPSSYHYRFITPPADAAGTCPP